MLLRVRVLLVAVLLVAMATVVDTQAPPAVAAAGDACAPNSSATQVTSVPRACVDGIQTLSSRGYITPRCITDAKALAQEAEYERGECFGAREDGNGPIFAEAIAQGRLVAQLNAAGVHGLSVPHGAGITPGVQWEPNFPNPDEIGYDYPNPDGTTKRTTPKSMRPDVIVYPHTTGGTLQVLEMKLTERVGGAGLAVAAAEATAYRDLLDETYLRDAELLNLSVPNSGLGLRSPWIDEFSVRLHDCRDGQEVWTDYKSSAPQPGVVLVDGQTRYRSCDEDDPGEDEGEAEAGGEAGFGEDAPNWVDCMVNAGEFGVSAGRWIRTQAEETVQHAYATPIIREVASRQLTATQLQAVSTLVGGGSAGATSTTTAGAAGLTTTSATASVATVASVAAAGVLVGVAGACALDPNAFGDPHLASLDRRAYDLQSVGEFHLVRVPGTDFDVQVRFVPMTDSISVTDAVAMSVGGERVELRRRGQVLINGDAGVVDADGHHVFSDGSVLVRSGRERLIATTNPSALVHFKNGNVSVLVDDEVRTEGLLGNNDDDPTNDFALPDGTSLGANPSKSTLHGTFANAWRLTQAESHFTYASGKSTADFTDLAFPANIVTITDFSPADIEVANTQCADAGVLSGPQFEGCVFDALVSGDPAWTQAAAAVTGELFDPNHVAFDEQGVLTENFTAPVGRNFASGRYLNDPSTSRVAGPFFDATPYGFHVVDVPRHDVVTLRARLVAYGQVDTDALTQRLHIDVDGNASLTTTLEGTQPTMDGAGSVSFVRSGQTTDGLDYSVYEVEVPLQHFGSALKVTFEPEGFRGIQNTALGINSLELSLTTPPAEQFSLTLPAVVTAGVPAAGAGVLESGGAQDEYTFEVVDPDHDLYVATTDGRTRTHLTLHDAAGDLLTPHSITSDGVRYDVDAGTHRLGVRGTNGPTTYGLHVNELPPDAVVSYQLGSAPVRATTTAAGQNAVIEFDAVEGERVQLETTNADYTTGGMKWMLVRPDGTNAWGNLTGWRSPHTLIDTMTLDQAGTWKVFIDPKGAAVGAVDFHAWSVPDDVHIAAQIDGPPIEVTTTAGQDAWVELDLTAGQRIQLQTTGAAYTTGGMKWMLVRPDGTYAWNNLNGWRNANALADTVTITESGTWKVLIDPGGTATGHVNLTTWSVPTDDVTVSYGLGDAATTITTASAGQGAVVTFPATQGQRIQLQTTNAAYTTGGMKWMLVRPDGSYAWSNLNGWRNANALADTTTLNQTGTWRVIINPQGTATGTVDFQAWTVPDDHVVPTELDAVTLTLQTTSPGQDAWVEFDAVTGQRIQLQTTNADYTSGGMKWMLVRPDGTYAWSNLNGWRNGNALADTTTLNQTGTWRVLIDPQGTATGSVDFQAWTVPDDVQIGYTLDDQPVHISTTSPGQGAIITFAGTTGQLINLHTTSADYTTGGMKWMLVRPDGTYAWSNLNGWRNANASITAVTLNQTGDWTVIINPQGTATGSVSFQATLAGS